jgi:hypothetical protein
MTSGIPNVLMLGAPGPPCVVVSVTDMLPCSTGSSSPRKTKLTKEVNIPDIKGTVQRKLTWVKSGINRQLMTCYCSDGYFFNLKGLRSLKSKNVFSALRGTLE